MPELDDVAEEVETNETTPPWVTQGTEDEELSVEGEDVSGAEPMDRTDVIEPAKGVTVTIKSVRLDTYTPEGGDWHTISMKPTLVVDEKGIDGKGRYKNKHLFPRMRIKVNREAYPEDFSKPFYAPRDGGAWGDYNTFLRALGFPSRPAPTNDKKFRDSLVGRKLVIDITKDRRRVKDASGKYHSTDEYENNVKYVGSPKAAAATTAEAAVS